MTPASEVQSRQIVFPGVASPVTMVFAISSQTVMVIPDRLGGLPWVQG